MARIKIKSPNSKDPGRLRLLLETLSRNDIYATKIIPVSDGFVVLTESDGELDKLFNNKTDKELDHNQFTPLIPPELKAHRSILIFKIDEHIYGHTEEDIQEELIAQNGWILDIANTDKFAKGKGLKITFHDSATAKKAQEKGLLAFSMRIPPYNIEQDKHHNITTCLRCYAMEDHYTSQCNKSKDYKICSECSGEGHTWRECQSGTKCCLTCEGEHSTLAMRCPKRKEIIKNKRKQEKEGVTSYTGAVKKNMNFAAMTQQSQPSPNTHNTIYQCMLHAHFVNAGTHGEYERVLNNLFTDNNLPTIKISETPNSLLILKKLEEGSNANIHGIEQQQLRQTQQQQQGQTQQQQKQVPHQQQKQQETKELEQQEIIMETTMENQVQEQAVKPKHHRHLERRQRRSLSRITGKDIGLSIYTTKNRGWVETPMRKQALLKGIEDKIIKWTYTDPNIREKEIMEKLVFGQIDLTDCFQLTEEDNFRKIKTGLLEERSPPPRPEKQRKEAI